MGLPDLLHLSAEFSAKLGVRDLPEIDRDGQSNVPGLYVAGDLADAPIIKAALRQGYDVAKRAAASLGERRAGGEALDVLVIGAGPAGIGAALALQELGLRFAVLERERPFATIQNFPKGKLIFSEPREVETPRNLWFEDARKEDLVERWDRALEQHTLPIEQPVEVLDAQRRGELFEVRARAADGERIYQARRVILATGKRGQPQRLGVPGEDLPHVAYALKDPRAHAGERVVVVGGGDSAVESACDLADAGARVTISHRGDGFHRAKPKNQQRIAALIAADRLTVHLQARPTRITPGAALLQRADGAAIEAPADRVLVLIGAKLPTGFLRRLGVRTQGEMTARRAAWIGAFMLLTWCFYVLKSGAECVGGQAARAICEGGQWVAKKPLFPFGPEHPLSFVPGLLTMDLGFRVVDAAFWGTSLYALLILVFGIRAYRRYPSPDQKRRYLSLIAFQWTLLFAVPELLAPLVIERPWKIYAMSVPWPLSIWSLIDAPSWAGGDALTAVLWLLIGALTTFVAIPLYVRRNGERFCSYLCGCGGLAETLGDFWRHLAPRGLTARKAETAGRIILLLAVPVTGLILADAWGMLHEGLYSTKAFAQHWYGLAVDFWLASIVGVALYPYLGNRVWCRFFCPLRAYMEELARRFSRIGIASNDRCIGCGECTRYCQMGIEVQRFAQQQVRMDNTNSACIQCGICVQVCPMDVLSVTRDGFVELKIPDPLRPPAAEWERRRWGA